MSTEQPLDSIVLAVISKFKARAVLGKQKYGTDLDRKDLKPADWIQHAQEELMDGILYLEKLKQELGAAAATNKETPSQSHLLSSPSLEELLQRHGC
jgi:hypothetical protein